MNKTQKISTVHHCTAHSLFQEQESATNIPRCKQQGILVLKEELMIIDTHIHIGGKAGTFDMKESDVLYAIQTYHIDKAIVSNADSLEFDANHVILPEKLQVSQYNSNVRMINFARNNSSRLYAAAWIKPNTERLDKQFSELLKRNLDIVKAIKVHPFYSALAFNNEKMYEYIELARKLNLPMITHTANDKFSNPELVFEMAKKYPDVKFIMAHLELDSDNKRATELCAQLPNLYADTAWVSLDSAISFIKKCGSEKLLFGSDTPIDGRDTYLKNKEGKRSIYQDYFFELEKRISPAEYENVMYKNAQRIFSL